jgi:hypothetical protein
MFTDLELHASRQREESHHGRPEVIRQVHHGGRGRPSYEIDPDFLAWAHTQRSTSAIARFLNVGRSTVRQQLLCLGLAERQHDPFREPDLEGEADELLNPQPGGTDPESEPSHNTSSSISDMGDPALDDLVLRLRSHYRRAGVTMLHGMLLCLGHRVPRSRIQESLWRIDPLHRVFQRIRIRRRTYTVPGPNSLWHHDGQHGTYIWSNFCFETNKCRSHPLGHCYSWVY